MGSKGFNNVQYGCEFVFVQVKSIRAGNAPSPRTFHALSARCPAPRRALKTLCTLRLPAMKSLLTPPPSVVLAPSMLTACDLVPNGDGSYRAVPRQPKSQVSVTEAARVANCSRGTIYRLYNSDLVSGERRTPRKIMINLGSLQAHLEAVRDPEFWTEERRRRFEQAR